MWHAIKKKIKSSSLLYHRYLNFRKMTRYRLQMLKAVTDTGIPKVYPDFLCIGAPRTGTTWLYNALYDHREVFFPKLKEAHFFDQPVIVEWQGQKQDINSQSFEQYFDLENEAHWRWYALQFLAGKDRVKGDITPAYSRLSEDRIELIASRLKDVKIIYMMRNPIERVWSGVRNFGWRATGKKVRDMSLEEMQEFAMHPRRLMSGDYKTVITRWEKYFDKSNILYLFYDDLVRDPYGQVEKVCAFLGIETPPAEEAGRIAKRVNASDEEEDLPPEILRLLQDYYAEQIPFLEQRFGQDFSHWKNL